MTLRIVALSDVHGEWGRITVPDGDLLIVAGDLCDDVPEERTAANDWLASMPHAHKLYVPGNHDLGGVYDATPFPSVHVLVDERIEIAGVGIYGAPWESLGRETWERKIPPGMDVLVTHEPPFGIRDWSHTSDTHRVIAICWPRCRRRVLDCISSAIATTPMGMRSLTYSVRQRVDLR